jgi:UDP:flavonoid glycosyltransferase YjiC (YdhE family)
MSGRYLFVGLDTGGTWKPMLGLASMMVQAGNHVSVLGSPSMRTTSEAAGCAFEPLPDHLDETPRTALEDDGFDAWVSKVCGQDVALALAPAVARICPDVLVVDFLQFNALSAAELIALPVASVVHLGLGTWAEDDEWAEEVELLNVTRVALGLEPLPPMGGIARLWSRVDVALSLLPRQWLPAPVPANVVTVGPIPAASRSMGSLELPWDRSDDRPLVVISMSSTYMHQEQLLSRIATVASQLPVRVLLSLAGSISEGDVQVPPVVAVREWLEFDHVLPEASVLITHGGMATISAGLKHGLPMLIIPQGRDQDRNAQRVVDSGAGIRLGPECTTAALVEALAILLDDDGYSEAARRFGAGLRAMGGGRLAVEQLERLYRLSSS